MESNLDAMDLEAEREGIAIGKFNEIRVKNHSKKLKVRTVDSKVLDKAFSDNIGCDYISRKEE